MTERVRITILVDNTSNHPMLLAEHGWAVWIEAGTHHILFDTGQSGIIQTNAQLLGIHLSDVDAIVLSHGHCDHTGGLMRILDGASKAKVFLHPDTLNPRYSCHSNKPVHNIGMPAHTQLYLSKQISKHNLVWTTEPTEVVPDIFVTGPIPRCSTFEDVGGPFFRDVSADTPDPLTDDQALFFDSAKGLVVILGCAHAGVVNTLDYIAELTGQDKFYTVLGGMHLGSASPERIKRTIEAFRIHDVARIGPAHCTGTQAAAQLWNAFPERCFSCSVSTKIECPLKTVNKECKIPAKPQT